MKTETPVMTATLYEPPQMTIVPLRASGSMLIGSVAPLETYSYYEDFRNNFQQAEDGGTWIDGFDENDVSGWGESFF